MFTLTHSALASNTGASPSPAVARRPQFPKANGLVAVLAAVALVGTSCGTASTEMSDDATSDLAALTTTLGQNESLEGRSAPLDLDLGNQTKPSTQGSKIAAPQSTVPPAVGRQAIDTDELQQKVPDEDWKPGGFGADLGVHRIAPLGDSAPFLIRWDEDTARHPGHTGEYTEVADGPFTQIVDAGAWGVVFQRPGDDTIWHKNLTEEAALIVSDDPTVTLLLEGVVMSDLEQGVVYYRPQASGDLAGLSTEYLRAFDLTTEIDSEVAVVAGYESDSHFNLIHTPRAISSSSGEGFVWSRFYDLNDGYQIEWFTCDAAGGSDCPRYEAIAAGSNTFYAMVKDDPSASSTTYRLLGINAGTGYTYTVHTFAWEQGVWDIEEFFVTSDGLVVISVMDGAGNPLPAAIVDRSTDQVWTVPEVDFVRPALLS